MNETVYPLVVRRLLIDLQPGFDQRWFGGDSFKTAFFNAMSMTFPVGEQFFMDSVRDCIPLIPESKRSKFELEVKGFVGQEATHRRIHDLFNQQLEKQGFANRIAVRLKNRADQLQNKSPLHRLAATAAYEHYTAVMSEWALSHPQVFNGVPTAVADMWMWHASEESEHKSVAFDVYQAAGGNLKWRRHWMRLVSINFVWNLGVQTVVNLRHDRALFKLSTWTSAYSFFFGACGLARKTFKPLREYMQQDFHPEKVGQPELSRTWLAENKHKWVSVGKSATLQTIN